MSAHTYNKAGNLRAEIARRAGKGFTLIEMIVVIAIMGILGGMIATFVGLPVQGYVDSARRSGMNDTADIALQRIRYDVRHALPNSVQVNPAPCSGSAACYLDLLSVSGSGRYRAAADPAATGPCGSAAAAVLDFTAADTCFEVLGPPVQFQTGDQVVINNLGTPGADAYSGNSAATDVRRAYAGASGVPVSLVLMTSVNPLPSSAVAQDFQIVHEQVRYICDPVAHTLTRYWGFTIVAPSAVTPTGGSNALLASNIGACSFSLPQGNKLLAMQLTITEKGDSISLYGAAHINTVP